jgi:hypothetical protein
MSGADPLGAPWVVLIHCVLHGWDSSIMNSTCDSDQLGAAWVVLIHMMPGSQVYVEHWLCNLTDIPLRLVYTDGTGRWLEPSTCCEMEEGGEGGDEAADGVRAADDDDDADGDADGADIARGDAETGGGEDGLDAATAAGEQPARRKGRLQG